MARRENELFIGKDNINIEGRTIKHPALIKEYATVNTHKISDEPIKLVGLDLETNHITGELKLLGFYDGEKYCHYEENFIPVLFSWIKYLERQQKNIAYWNRLDPFILYKQFLLTLTEEEATNSMKRFGKISGEWDRKSGKWKVQPVIKIKYGRYYFGIQTAIRSSVKFFYYKEGSRFLNTVWAYDIAQLYEKSLEKEALGKLDKRTNTYPNARLKYYSKLGEEYHKIDWDRYKTDKEFNKNVLYSNELDARAVYDLGNIIQEDFYKAFNWYPKTLVSSGSLARSSILAVIHNKYAKLYPDQEKKIAKKTLEDVKSIGFINYYDKWANTYGGEFLKDFYCMLVESYSGGYIESLMYGYAKKGYYADIASAYPAVIKELYDLRGCKITTGEGEPPHIDKSYCFIRGMVNIPLTVNYHPVTVKHPINKDTNIRATGKYRASYSIEERDFLIEEGATFSDEKWYNFETKGILSPLAEVEQHLLELRDYFISIDNSSQYIAKKSANSGYGLLFEAVNTYEEDNEDVYRAGYRGGEFFNPLYASIITSRTRILISKATRAIKKAGGEPILIMTDSIFWKGTKEMLPKEFYKDKKTVGYFEAPDEVEDITCLGSGRYSYKDIKEGYMTSKKRGLNIVDIHDPDGVIINDFNWLEALKLAERTNNTIINVKVRTLISVGVIIHNGNYGLKDLGLVVEQDREVDLIVGKSKRFYKDELKDPKILAHNLVNTTPIYLASGMFGDGEVNDQTLPVLRSMIKDLKVVTAKDKDRKNRSTASMKYSKKHKSKLADDYNHKYKQVRAYGYEPLIAKKMAKWGMERILNQIKEDKRRKESKK